MRFRFLRRFIISLSIGSSLVFGMTGSCMSSLDSSDDSLFF